MGQPEYYDMKGSVQKHHSDFRFTVMSVEEIVKRDPFCGWEHSNRKRLCIINAQNVNYS